MTGRQGPLKKRFWRMIILPEDRRQCWFWNGFKSNGYGQIQISAGRYEKAHRVAYKLFTGPIPEGKHVLHKCDNPSCVNPKHLFLGTQSDNNADMRVKGRARYAWGERSGSAKLTWPQVQKIREQYRFYSRMFGSVALGRRYGVTSTMILFIVKGDAWREEFK